MLKFLKSLGMKGENPGQKTSPGLSLGILNINKPTYINPPELKLSSHGHKESSNSQELKGTIRLLEWKGSMNPLESKEAMTI